MDCACPFAAMSDDLSAAILRSQATMAGDVPLNIPHASLRGRENQSVVS